MLRDELDRAVFIAYGWDDLAAQLVGKPGATTPLPHKSEVQAEAEEELLRRLVELNTSAPLKKPAGIFAGCSRNTRTRRLLPLSPALSRKGRGGRLKPVSAPYSEQTTGQRKAVAAARRIILKSRLPLVEFEQTDKITAFAQQFS